MQVAVHPERQALPLGRSDGVVPHGPDIVGEVVGDGVEEVVETVRAPLGVVAAVLTDRCVSGRLHVECLEEARQRVGRVVAAADRGVVQWLAGNPRHDGPGLRETRGRFTDPHGVRDRERQSRGQDGQPPALLALEIRGTFCPRHAHGQLVSKAPLLVDPPAHYFADGQPCKVRVLLLQQVMDQVSGNLDLGVRHTKPDYWGRRVLSRTWRGRARR